jgi:hypothetical protein
LTLEFSTSVDDIQLVVSDEFDPSETLTAPTENASFEDREMLTSKPWILIELLLANRSERLIAP